MRLICTPAMMFFVAVFWASTLRVQAAQIPAWVFETPRSGTGLLAVGTGKTVAAARQVALGNILLQVSQNMQASTDSTIEGNNGVANTRFRQQARGESLELDVGQGDIARQWQDPESGEVYLQLSVARDELVRALNDRLAGMTALRFPEASSQTDQLLWSLRYLESLELGLRLERALAGLGKGHSKARNQLSANRHKALAIWQSAGVRVIARHSLASVTNLVTQRLPTSTNTVLWLQLDQQTHHRESNGRTEIKRVLYMDLKQPQPPFTSYYQRELVAIGAGADRKSAAQAAEQVLTDKLNKPLASWLF